MESKLKREMDMAEEAAAVLWSELTPLPDDGTVSLIIMRLARLYLQSVPAHNFDAAAADMRGIGVLAEAIAEDRRK